MTAWTAACQAFLSFTIFQSLLKLMSIELAMPSNHLTLCCPLLLPSIFPSIRVFSNELALHIRGPQYWSFSFSISPSNEYSGLISLELTGWISWKSKGLLRVFSSTTVQKHQFFSTQPSLWSNFHIHTWLLEKWVAIPFSRQSSRPRDRTQVSCTVRWILYCLSHQGSQLTRTLKITYVAQITFLLDSVLV